MSSGSISFDRAAPYYDRTRGLSEEALSRLIPMVAAELPRGERILEVGVGTGRIALPLVREGVRIVGIDIAAEMLSRLREKADGAGPPLAIADATRLPFADDAFGGAVAAHVLHLLPDWRNAVSEIFRVVRPQGVVIASRGGRTQSGEWWNAIRREFFRAAGDRHWPPGMDRIEELDEEMASRGAVVTKLPEITETKSASVRELLALLDEGVWSACWSIDPDTRRLAVESTRRWAVEKFGDLDERRPLTEVLGWRSYRLP